MRPSAYRSAAGSGSYFARERNRFGQIEDHTLQMRVTLAGCFRQMPRRFAQIDQTCERGQIKGGHDVRGTDQSKAVHAHQEFALGFLGAKKVRKDRTVPAIRLLPAVMPVTHGILQV
jgi:hypothetical protein